jgi:hypothetical protein
LQRGELAEDTAVDAIARDLKAGSPGQTEEQTRAAISARQPIWKAIVSAPGPRGLTVARLPAQLQAIEPTGMSGGGLFDLGISNLASLTKLPQPAHLAGILTEYHLNKNRRMVAVKIGQ